MLGGENGGFLPQCLQPTQSIDAKVAIQPVLQLLDGKCLRLIIAPRAGDLEILKHGPMLAGSVDDLVLTLNRSANVVRLWTGTAPKPNLQAGEFADRRDRLRQGEMKFAARRDPTLNGRPMADDRSRIEVGGDLQPMAAHNVSRGRLEVVGVELRGELTQLAAFDGTRDLARTLGVRTAEEERHKRD